MRAIVIKIITCPLCQSKNHSLIHKDSYREYLSCSDCRFVFVPKSFHLSETDEKLRYDTHNNNPLDNRYRNFLSQLEEPLLQKIPEKSYGLDNMVDVKFSHEEWQSIAKRKRGFWTEGRLVY